jgi:hypothetical protein
VKLTGDGKIVLGGATDSGVSSDFGVVRFVNAPAPPFIRKMSLWLPLMTN